MSQANEAQYAPQTYIAGHVLTQNEYRAYLRERILNITEKEGGIIALIDWINDVEDKILNEWHRRPDDLDVTIDEVRKFFDEAYPPARTTKMVRARVR